MSYSGMEPLVIENARIVFRNFAGEESAYNRKGNRNFSVVISDEATADRLIADGWNVKKRPAREDGEPPFCHLPVTVRFDNFPPKVILMTRTAHVQLNEHTVETLDRADLETVDVCIAPSRWEVNGKTGVKAYLKTLYAVKREDEFESKYADRFPEEDL